jgi:sterol desaturase/sphingolipid hydroxylase (fatty acid hydroxylase superfamily)
MTAKNKIYVLGTLVLTLIAVLCVYYFDKLSLLWEQPERFKKLFLDASQLSKLTWNFVWSTLIIAIGAIVIDLILLGWKNSSIYRLIKNPSRSAKNDWWSFILSLTKIYELGVLILSAGIFYFIASLFVNYFNLNLGGFIKNDLVLFCLLFVVTDFKNYISHRFMHLNPFWELHAYHHSAEEFNLITTTRGHFTESGLKYGITGFFLAILGNGVDNIAELSYILFAVVIFREWYEYILHSNIDYKLGWIGKYILIHPPAHKLHHSIDPIDYNKNYGTFFIWWDKLFGTYKEPNGPIEIGIPDNPYNNVNFLPGQWASFKRFVKKVTS